MKVKYYKAGDLKKLCQLEKEEDISFSLLALVLVDHAIKKNLPVETVMNVLDYFGYRPIEEKKDESSISD